MTEYARIKTTFEVGILAVGFVENTLGKYCFDKGYELSIEKGSGIFKKPMFIEIICPKNKYKQAITEIKELFVGY